MASLLNKVIIITGASTGIGACIARYLAQFKPKLVLVARSPDKLKTVSERCVKAGCEEGNVITVTADMAKDEDLERVINDAVSAFGHLDVLVNNAASFAVSDVHHTTPAEFDRTMAVNIRAPFFLSQAAILHLKKTQGCIVNISSVAAHCGWDHMAAYSISKAALEQLTKVLAYELAPSNVRVNAAIVGFTKTDTMEDYAKFLRMDVAKNDPSSKSMLKAQPLGGMCSMEDVAKVVAFLASDLACGMTGTCVPVDRGNLIVPPDPDMPETLRNVGNVNDVATQLRLDQLAAYGPDEITSPHTNGRHH